MGRGFTAAWLVAAALLASWAVSSASNERRVVASAGVPRALPEAARVAEAEIARLVERRRVPAAAVPAGQRDPFTFGRPYTGAPPRPASAPVAADVEVGAADSADSAEAPVPPSDPVPALAGIAELGTRGVVAVISYAGDLHYVSRGDVIAGRYRVDAIAANGVEVFDLMLGTNSRLILQRP